MHSQGGAEFAAHQNGDIVAIRHIVESIGENAGRIRLDVSFPQIRRVAQAPNGLDVRSRGDERIIHFVQKARHFRCKTAPARECVRHDMIQNRCCAARK